MVSTHGAPDNNQPTKLPNGASFNVICATVCEWSSSSKIAFSHVFQIRSLHLLEAIRHIKHPPVIVSTYSRAEYVHVTKS